MIPTSPELPLARLRGMRPPLLIVALLLAPAAACDGRRNDLVEARGEEALEEAPEPEKRPAPATVPEHIYYDLTTFEWYQRGEPLRIDGLEYQPRGKPISLGDAHLEVAGEYEGVVYYKVEDASEPYAAVYVAVSPRYWQPFVTEIPEATETGS